MELKYTYEQMPKDDIQVEGMKVVNGNTNNYRVKIKDVSYNKEGYELSIRLLIPERLDQTQQFPIYMHVQGSAWMKQDMFNHIEDLKQIAEAGYIVAILPYRPTPDHLFPTQVKDAKSDIRYLYEHKDELGIDFTKAFLGGDSSGGHTALMCYVTYHSNLFTDENTHLPELKGFIDCYGPVNIISMVDQVSGVDRSENSTYPEALLIGHEVRTHQEEAKATNPIHYLDKQKEPLLILHGNKDRLVPFRQSVELYKACKQKGLNVEFYCVDDADHGGSAFWCKNVLDIIIDFMKLA